MVAVTTWHVVKDGACLWPQVQTFGSFVNGLGMHSSDLDLVVTGLLAPDHPQNGGQWIRPRLYNMTIWLGLNMQSHARRSGCRLTRVTAAVVHAGLLETPAAQPPLAALQGTPTRRR